MHGTILLLAAGTKNLFTYSISDNGNTSIMVVLSTCSDLYFYLMLLLLGGHKD